MAFESDRVMFEIYRESFSRKFKVVYFTELQDHNKEWEINRALSGEHFYDGFIRNYRKEEAKAEIQRLLDRMNTGDQISPEQFEEAIRAYIPATA